MRRYIQLGLSDRSMIAKCRARRLSISEIARLTGFSKSTISRELRRNFGYYGGYWAGVAQHKRNLRKKVAMAKRPGSLAQSTRGWILKKLSGKWSPEQISGRSKLEGRQSVSHQAIYNLIREDRASGGHLYLHLRRSHRHRYRKGEGPRNVKLRNRVDISTRPKVVDKRIRLGDLEGDLIVGRHQLSHIAVVADRVSRLVGLEKVKTKARGLVNGPLKKAIQRNGRAKTLTLDNGLEFSAHEKLGKDTGLDIYFAHAYSAWERGTVENMNRLVRQYLPKKTDFRKVSSRKLREIENTLNNRPRKCLGYLTPNERHFGRPVDTFISKN